LIVIVIVDVVAVGDGDGLEGAPAGARAAWRRFTAEGRRRPQRMGWLAPSRSP
jgi:hypothetical protein